jgi:hypothetical protein
VSDGAITKPFTGKMNSDSDIKCINVDVNSEFARSEFARTEDFYVSALDGI